jgi:DNA-binding protein HU-beta
MSQSAEKPMTKSQLLNHLSEKTGLNKAQVGSVLDELAQTAYSEAKSKEKGFTVPGLGKLVLVNRAARSGRNPATGETIEIPAKKVVKFRLAKVAKDSILG